MGVVSLRAPFRRTSSLLRAAGALSLAVALGTAVGSTSAGATARSSGERAARAPKAATPRFTAPRASVRPHATSARPHFVRPRAVNAKVFTVDTVLDSPLASATLKTCEDAANHHCSLRAALTAANNLNAPVLVKLGAHTYTLTDTTDGSLLDTNAGGTTVEGASTHGTKINAVGFDATAIVVGENATTDKGASLTLENLSVAGGHGTDGGGVAASDYNVGLVLDGVDVSGGAAEYGGGVYCDDASMWITNSIIYGNSATLYGGGLYSYWCSAYVTHTNIDSNTVSTTTGTVYGGGVYSEYGGVRFLDCNVSYDAAGSLTEAGEGGGIMSYYATDTLIGTSVSHDVAYDDGEGGGADLYYGEIDTSSSSFTYDRALGTSAVGGGIDLDYAAHAELHDTKIEYDSTTATSGYDAGGGVYLYGYEGPSTLLVDDNSAISHNKTGAINVYDYYGGTDLEISNSTIQGNTSTLAGAGGIFVYNEYGGTTVKLADDQLLANSDSVEDSAGGMYLYPYYGGITATVTDTLVRGNVDVGKYSSGGIGSYLVYGGGTLDMSNSQVLDNRAPDLGYGGGIGMYDEDASEGQLSLSHDTIEGNSAGSSNSSHYGYGGGIYLYELGFIDLVDSVVSHNAAYGAGSGSGEGGGIYNDSALGSTYAGDTITDNKATGTGSEGGGIWDYPYYEASRLIQSTLSDNTATLGAGAYVDEYSFLVDSSTITGNVAGSASAEGQGGGIYSYASQVTVDNSTITGNRAVTAGHDVGEGGAFYTYDGNVDSWFATIAGNVAASGSGFYGTDDGSGTLRDSILTTNHPSAASKAENDCRATSNYSYLESLGGNVIGQASCVAARTPSDDVSSKPELGPLAANGGPTMTMALLTHSPAINLAAGDCLPTDQRGEPRPGNGHCDAGAYQLVATKHKA